MRRAVLVVACLGLVFASPAAAAPGDLLIANRGFGVSVLGPYRPKVDGTLSAAARAFGPDFRRYGTCEYRWPAIGLTIHAENLGAGPPCMFVQSVTINGPGSQRWRTSRGLRVGMTLTTLRRLYPRTTRHGIVWWLTSVRSPFGDNGPTDVISAIVRGGRVTALRGWVGAAGE